MIRYLDEAGEIMFDPEGDDIEDFDFKEYLEYITEEAIVSMSDEDYEEFLASRKVDQRYIENAEEPNNVWDKVRSIVNAKGYRNT